MPKISHQFDRYPQEVMPLKIYIPSYGDSYLQIFPTQIKFFIQK